jgi:hypothetical protein
VFGNVLEFFARQHFHLAAALVVGAAHLLSRDLQLKEGVLEQSTKALVVQRTRIVSKLRDTAATKNMTAIETWIKKNEELKKRKEEQ